MKINNHKFTSSLNSVNKCLVSLVGFYVSYFFLLGSILPFKYIQVITATSSPSYLQLWRKSKKRTSIFLTVLCCYPYSTVFVSFTGNKPVLFLPVLLICTSVSTSSPPFTITPLIYPISCA